jgi:ABC-type transport system involved in multi-copper enzyme maturation permease subunit
VSALLQAELLKLRTTRTFFALVGTALGISLLVVLLFTLIPDADGIGEADVGGFFTLDFTGIFILLLGAMGMAGEWRHRTITGTILAAPDRIRLLAAKVIAYAIAGPVLSLVVSLASGLVATLILSIRGVDVTIGVGDVADILWRNLVAAALTGALGVCIGAIVRQQVAVIVGALVFTLMVGPALLGLAPEVGRYLPTVAPAGLYNVSDGALEVDRDLLEPLGAVLVSVAWIAGLFAVGAATLKRRDLV